MPSTPWEWAVCGIHEEGVHAGLDQVMARSGPSPKPIAAPCAQAAVLVLVARGTARSSPKSLRVITGPGLACLSTRGRRSILLWESSEASSWKRRAGGHQRHGGQRCRERDVLKARGT